MIWRRFTSEFRFALGLALLLMLLAIPAAGAAPQQAAPEPATLETGIGISGLPLPRFVSITSTRVNLRVGPGRQYPINWILQRRHLPVEIIGEFEHWRKIRERSGDVGWVHKTMLSGKRMGMVISNSKTGELTPAFEAAESGKAVLMAEDGAIGEIRECRGEWCAMQFDKRRGWMRRDTIWGVYPVEDFK